MQQPSFSAEPPSSAVAELNTTAPFVWNITNSSSCLYNTNTKSDEWRLKVAMNELDLYPISQLEDNMPFKNNTDYIVHIECQNNNTIVNLTIIFNENVVEYADFILCRVTRRKDGKQDVVESQVKFTTIVQTTETTTVTMVTPTSLSALKMETTTNSGCRQCVHFSSLALCIFVASLLGFSWQS